MAMAAQMVAEERITAYANEAFYLTKSTNLVFMGGVALNCVANGNLFKFFDNIHIMPNPGDAGSSLGAAALEYYNQTGKKVNWSGAYLGNDIPGKEMFKEFTKG
jgi:carbamoyltransferase